MYIGMYVTTELQPWLPALLNLTLLMLSLSIFAFPSLIFLQIILSSLLRLFLTAFKVCIFSTLYECCVATSLSVLIIIKVVKCMWVCVCLCVCNSILYSPRTNRGLYICAACHWNWLSGAATYKCKTGVYFSGILCFKILENCSHVIKILCPVCACILISCLSLTSLWRKEHK